MPAKKKTKAAEPESAAAVEPKPEKKKERAPVKISEIIKANGLIKGAFIVERGSLKVIADAADGTKHNLSIPLDGKNAVDLVLS